MSQISIPNYPSSNLVPGVYLTVDASQANTDAVPQRALIIGQQLSNAPSLGGQPNGSTLSFTLGSYAPNVPALAGSVADVQQMAGHGSQLALMYAAYRKLDPSGEVWLLPLDDDPSAVLAAGSITIAGTATQAGVLSFYIAGQLVPVRVSVGDTREILGNNILAAINASRDLPCFAAALTDDTDTSVFTVQLQALNLGAIANDINLRLNYQGASGGEQTPAGLTMGFAAFSGGVQNPTALAAALANLSSQPYDYICCPYNDTTSLNTIESFLNDQTGRWSFDEQLFGHAFFAYRGTIGQRATFFATRDDQHTSGIGFYDSPSPEWEWAAALTAAAAVSVDQDPALPIKDFILPVLAPPQANQDTIGERNTMLTDGCATFNVNASNQVVLERVVTTFTTDPSTGVPDNAYQQAETMFTLMAVMRNLRIQLATQFGRKKLVADGTIIPGGSNMVTSQTVLATVIALYRTMAAVNGWVQNPAEFAQQALAQNAGNGNVRLFLPIQIANQLWTIAGNVQFTKP